MSAPIRFDAALTDAQIHDMEAGYTGNAKAFGVTRRAALALLTMSADELHDSIKRNPDAVDAYLETVEVVGDYIKTLAGVQETMEVARTRLLVVLSEELGVEVPIKAEPPEAAAG